MKKRILLLALFVTVTISSCGQHNPTRSTDPLSNENETVASRVTVYNSLNSGSFPEYLNMNAIQRTDLKTFADHDITQRNTLIETARQGHINYEIFAQYKNDLNQKFSDHFLNLLTPDQSSRYEFLRSEALNAYYTPKANHPYWNIVKLIEMIDE